jgi:hypothetical protein
MFSQEKEAKGEYVKKEDVIQEHFPLAMSEIFPNLSFYDTHVDSYIASPQKPDISVTYHEHLLHTLTVLVFIELKHTTKSIDGTAMGEVASAVNRLWMQLPDKRDLWGIVMNGGEDNFLYLKQADGDHFFS